MELTEAIKRNKLLLKLRFVKKKKRWSKWNIEIESGVKYRSEGNEDENFQEIKKFEKLYTGKRCFIIATGPSLTLQDLDLLKKEYTFGMNSICKIYEDTEWRPTFYGIQDIFVYSKLQDTIKKYYNHNCKNVFVADQLDKFYEVPAKYVRFPYNGVYHLYDQQFGHYYAKFSDNAYNIVYDGYSITYSLIQIAIYMGFKEIYLLGADCSYPVGEKNHFIESGFIDKKAYLNHDKMIVGYQEAKMYAGQHNIQIVNCTRGGMLEVFKRMTLEEILERKI